VDPQFVHGLQTSGYQFTSDDMIHLHDNGVSAEFPKQLKAAGLSRVSTRDMINMWQNGVNGDYIVRLEASGMKGLTPEQIIKLKQHGVD
jgi:hypothetical protein